LHDGERVGATIGLRGLKSGDAALLGAGRVEKAVSGPSTGSGQALAARS